MMETNSETKILSAEEIDNFVAEYPDWQVTDGELKAEFKLKDFAEAMEVVKAVAGEAERLNHHPTWTNSYNKLSFVLCTHDADDQITTLDIELAKVISTIVNDL